ncbi:HD-like signal output (HDOD) domain, no enzymatic activity [Colwellia chukchiensis]|uniref:HD-like signal output (HDOD) domain, no enzymatic activity n=1 Tax=Colwellia chukchiensis TaxID=641665 RepID=A0A1H7G8V1_9GAMM|nr:HDOD domain-containing protein [Colwellia chukchiensis]SEK33242.1 HD-like signal output (HDOD) domain, no enzymatic activity [Colwellia chukchiensis]
MRILLLDDVEPNLLALKQALSQSRQKFVYACGLNAGVSALAQDKFNIVICAEQVEKNSGSSILTMVAKKFPAMVRILILTNSAQTSTPKSSAHYSFCAPLDHNNIIETISQLASNHQAITKDVIVNTIANIKVLPSPPKVYMQLNEVLKAANTDSHKIADIIQQDPALTAKVLQFSNNTFATRGKPMLSISDAITKMGIETLCCIVMTAELFAYQPKIKGFSIVNAQMHALATAKLAASLVSPALKQDTMIAGLLHDIGKVVLYELNEKSTALFFKHQQQTDNKLALENKIFASDHCHVGGYLLHTWGFSYDIIAATILHHSPEKLLAKSFGIAQAVYLANTLLHQQAPEANFIKHYNLSASLPKLTQRATKMA